MSPRQVWQSIIELAPLRLQAAGAPHAVLSPPAALLQDAVKQRPPLAPLPRSSSSVSICTFVLVKQVN
jgi:hypothetical protein